MNCSRMPWTFCSSWRLERQRSSHLLEAVLFGLEVVVETGCEGYNKMIGMDNEWFVVFCSWAHPAREAKFDCFRC